jgi:pimeloyl-ACP methyl ester carboxylesterase
MARLDRREAARTIPNREAGCFQIRRRLGLAAVALGLGLSAGCASIVVHERPILDRETHEVVATSGSETSHGKAHGLIQAGMALDKKHPNWATLYYRDAALAALPAVLEEGLSPSGEIEHSLGAQSTYRRAIEYALIAVDRQAKAQKVPWTEILARSGIGVEGKVSLFEAALWQEVLPSREFEVKGFHRQVGQGGLGAPVVIHMARTVEPKPLSLEGGEVQTDPSERHFPAQLYRAASAVIRPGRAGEPPAVLELHDPVAEPDMRWQPAPDAPSLPLAYDMTIGLARQFHEGNLDLIGALGVLYPSEYDSKTGIFMLDPYQPGKIPVVLVHGLMSTPGAWANAINELRGDPELRKRYQFWMFFYSTGNPILGSAARLRQALQTVREEFNPNNDDPAFDRMLVIGHSMGGLLSRLMVSSSGDILWNAAANVPPDAIDLDPKLKQMLMESSFFEPVPSVNRVVFISTPHRGSPMGDDLIGRVASRLIRVPKEVLDIRSALAKLQGAEGVAREFRSNRYATSVAQLGLENPVLRSIGRLPMKESIPYHSIIGYNGKAPLPDGSDGVVPYTSAHMEGALSELVVSSDHSAQETEMGIREMRRIMTIHFNEYAEERRAIAKGDRPPNRIARPDGKTPVHYALAPKSEVDEAERQRRLARIGIYQNPDAPVRR